ncbi:CatB-related O-acetyltransferase [Aliarcobacter lanthieri]|uniref:CatB-related O-acetyltransferase n=1 Tax=Aliarcobacter lanthieri TaxID=1355374 RepID=UPI003AAA4BB9
MKLSYIWSKILKKLRLSALKNCKIDKTSKIESGCNLVNVEMNRHSFCGYNCEMTNVEIGSFCSIANGVIIGGGMHPIDWVSMSPVFYEGRDSVKAKFSEHKRDKVLKTMIGHDVWIGQNCLIKQGITIGNGAVIGMGSVVTKNVEPYTIVAGNPAKFIRKRFNDEIIENLEKSKWWNFSDLELKYYAKYFKKPSTFLEELERKIRNGK